MNIIKRIKKLKYIGLPVKSRSRKDKIWKQIKEKIKIKSIDYEDD